MTLERSMGTQIPNVLILPEDFGRKTSLENLQVLHTELWLLGVLPSKPVSEVTLLNATEKAV